MCRRLYEGADEQQPRLDMLWRLGIDLVDMDCQKKSRDLIDRSGDSPSAKAALVDRRSSITPLRSVSGRTMLPSLIERVTGCSGFRVVIFPR